MRITTIGALVIIIVVLYYSLPFLIDTVETTFSVMEQNAPRPRERQYGLYALYNQIETWFSYIEKVVTNPYTAGILIAIGMIFLAFEITWRTRK